MGGDPLRVWLLSDGLPGHYHQAVAIANALAAERPVEVVWVDLRLRVGLARRLLRFILNRTGRPLSPRRLTWFYRGVLPAGRPDLVISAGGRTSFANAWVGRWFRAPNFFAGSLRGLSARHFTAVLTLEAVAGAANNIVLDLPLSRVDPRTLAGLPIPDHWRRPCWALLAGGDGAGYRYGEADWRRLVEALGVLAQAHGIRWLVSGSRRTGATLPALLADNGEGFIEDVDFHTGEGESGLLRYLAAADKVFVTEDSMSMLSEAMGSGKPVFSLSPAHARPNARYLAALARFEGRGLIRRLAIRDLADCGAERLEGLQPPNDGASSRRLAGRLASFLPD
jgi:mitochondrial fission protein ELM1